VLKKIIAASAIFVFFACSGKDNFDLEEADNSSNGSNIVDSSSSQGEGNGSSSSSSQDEVSSSSSLQEESSSSSSDPGPQVEKINIASFNNKASEAFGSNVWPYAFTLRKGEKEDLEQFWNVADAECPATSQTKAPDQEKCELDKTDAVLQNPLTNQSADLHYDIVMRNVTTSDAGFSAHAIGLQNYNLRESGDQAALGLSVGGGANEGKTIEELGITKLDGIDTFIYSYTGGVHRFRASENDDDYWEYEVHASASDKFEDLEIPLSELVGVGAHDGEPFELSKVAKFLWVIEYDSGTPANNKGSLMVSKFKGQKPAQ